VSRVIGFVTCAFVLCFLPGCGADDSSAPRLDTATPTTPAAIPRSAAAPGATVFFIEPTDGATVTSPVAMKFGVSGIAIAPAGEIQKNAGHHHVLVDTTLADMNLPIPKDAQHLHFGKGQTEAAIELEPGDHTLQLVLGDSNHIPHIPPVVSNRITITVE
jgi:hypothetical protein